MNNEVRAAAVNRSEGACEACGRFAGEALHCDHAFGRRETEHVSTVWMLCPSCDRAKTDNAPSAQHWIRRFMEHCRKHDYEVSHQRAAARLAVQVLKWGEQP